MLYDSVGAMNNNSVTKYTIIGQNMSEVLYLSAEINDVDIIFNQFSVSKFGPDNRNNVAFINHGNFFSSVCTLEKEMIS